MTRIEDVEQFCNVKFNYDLCPEFFHDVCVFGKIFNLAFDFDDFDKIEKIEAVQVDILKEFWLNQGKYYDKAKEAIQKYLHSRKCTTLYTIPRKFPEDIFEYITPIGVFISGDLQEIRPALLGLTFDCPYLGDVGICVAFKDGEIFDVGEEALLY